jgi:uncharacterized membrane protein
MQNWHITFEREAPDQHKAFLQYLQISDVEIELIAILAASIITYSCRLGGLLLAERLPRTGPLRSFLDALPKTILTELAVPSAANGWQGLIGVIACLTVHFKAHSPFSAIH